LFQAIIAMSLDLLIAYNAALAMGYLGGYPPFLAVWQPFLLFLLIGETVLVRT
jgi:lipopolysaccharide export system permease protein